MSAHTRSIHAAPLLPAAAVKPVPEGVFSDRAARPPLPFASTLASVTCFCGLGFTPADLHQCSCGRRWQRTAFVEVEP